MFKDLASERPLQQSKRYSRRNKTMHPALAEHVKNTVLNQNIRVPEGWKGGKNKIKTRTELKHFQKYEPIPDPSCDIDGDGIVSNRDLVRSSDNALGTQ